VISWAASRSRRRPTSTPTGSGRATSRRLRSSRWSSSTAGSSRRRSERDGRPRAHQARLAHRVRRGQGGRQRRVRRARAARGDPRDLGAHGGAVRYRSGLGARPACRGPRVRHPAFGEEGMFGGVVLRVLLARVRPALFGSAALFGMMRLDNLLTGAPQSTSSRRCSWPSGSGSASGPSPLRPARSSRSTHPTPDRGPLERPTRTDAPRRPQPNLHPLDEDVHRPQSVKRRRAVGNGPRRSPRWRCSRRPAALGRRRLAGGCPAPREGRRPPGRRLGSRRLGA
jgi:hypothetical protein